MKQVPSSLRTWFTIHFVVDYLFAIPLFIAPAWFLSLFGFTVIDPVTARLVAAALFAVGGISLLSRNESVDAYKALLKLKIIWSVSAIAGLLVSLWQGAPKQLWLVVLIFALFCGIWSYYFLKLR
ncbi:hypothetical protein HYV87_01730 [Candidatus Woesearchaeota archaeon]|nr:hypothetical protein [Candidatus Woesearchaeota archaeon]MBI2581833.1 hypothetical protein [Candidatus Woesearchaeota archaeon]